MAETAENIIHGLYTHFLLRDLKFILTGGAPLAYLVWTNNDWTPFEKAPTLALLGFVGAAYFLGIILFHAGISLPWPRLPFIRMFPRVKGRTFEDLAIESKAGEGLSDDQRRTIERTVFIKEVNGAAAVSCTSLILLLAWEMLGSKYDTLALLPWNKAGILGFLAIASITSLIQNRKKARIQRALEERGRKHGNS